MPNMKPICLALVLLCALFSTAAAQDSSSSTQRSTLTITVAVTGERVRITAPSSVVQMHVEVYAASGEKLFDQEIRGGNVFDWHLQDGQAQRLAPGAYVCVVTAKSVSGRLTQKLDVAGTIRAQRFLVVKPDKPGSQAAGDSANDSANSVQPLVSGVGTTGQLPKWTDGPSGALGDSVITETASGNIGIRTASPSSYLHGIGGLAIYGSTYSGISLANDGT